MGNVVTREYVLPAISVLDVDKQDGLSQTELLMAVCTAHPTAYPCAAAEGKEDAAEGHAVAEVVLASDAGCGGCSKAACPGPRAAISAESPTPLPKLLSLLLRWKAGWTSVLGADADGWGERLPPRPEPHWLGGPEALGAPPAPCCGETAAATAAATPEFRVELRAPAVKKAPGESEAAMELHVSVGNRGPPDGDTLAAQPACSKGVVAALSAAERPPMGWLAVRTRLPAMGMDCISVPPPELRLGDVPVGCSGRECRGCGAKGCSIAPGSDHRTVGAPAAPPAAAEIAPPVSQGGTAPGARPSRGPLPPLAKRPWAPGGAAALPLCDTEGLEVAVVVGLAVSLDVLPCAAGGCMAHRMASKNGCLSSCRASGRWLGSCLRHSMMNSRSSGGWMCCREAGGMPCTRSQCHVMDDQGPLHRSSSSVGPNDVRAHGNACWDAPA